MALAFLLIGLALVVAAFRNTQSDLFSLVGNDAPGFLKWAAAILAIGLLGYIPNFETAAKYLLVLVLLVVVIQNKGAFANFQAAVQGGASAVTVPAEPSLAGTPTIDVVTSGSGSGGSGGGGGAAGAAKTATGILGAIGGLFAL